jgi:hypothetical protein
MNSLKLFNLRFLQKEVFEKSREGPLPARNVQKTKQSPSSRGQLSQYQVNK